MQQSVEKQTNLTALMSCFARAYHAKNAALPVFDDFLAEKLMTEEEYEKIRTLLLNGADFFLSGEKEKYGSEESLLQAIVNRQLAPAPLARQRFCEDALLTEIKLGAKQYVVLGAGLDTFAYRAALSSPPAFRAPTVLEVDRLAVQRDKIARLQRAKIPLPKNLKFVPVDFSKDSLAEQLVKAGFDPTQKSFFSMLGVSYYLSPEEFSATVGAISSLLSEGGALVFDCGDENLFSSSVSPRVKNMLALAKAGGEEMKSCFSYSQTEKILSENGFLIYEFMTPQEIGESYFHGRTDGLSAFENTNFVLAVKKTC